MFKVDDCNAVACDLGHLTDVTTPNIINQSLQENSTMLISTSSTYIILLK